MSRSPPPCLSLPLSLPPLRSKALNPTISCFSRFFEYFHRVSLVPGDNMFNDNTTVRIIVRDMGRARVRARVRARALGRVRDG
eukprot:1373917-Amorphochlora_amoeboformis.AAC.1